MTFDYATLRPDSSHGDMQFVIYTPVDDPQSRAGFAKLMDGTAVRPKRSKPR
jgi:hypothetical protein